jgi:tripeptide aminopeptidase
MKSSVAERLLNYVSFDTRSDAGSDKIPSTDGQMVFARALKEELEGIGMTDVSLDNNAFLMATLPANTDDALPTVGFIAHLDTSPDMTGYDVKPKIIRNYDGRDIILNDEPEIVLSPALFPELLNHRGEDLIVTDGTTLLGADDKAGIAEIVTAMEYLISHPEIKHGKVRIAFTPDEETGRGVQFFDLDGFGCDWAYTVDGGEVGELEYENFNAAEAKVTIRGLNIHPGSAKGKMRNAAGIAVQFADMLPEREKPEHTEGYEGFFHLTGIKGSVEEACLSYIVRDHDMENFKRRLRLLEETRDSLNCVYPGAVSLEIRQQYRNMREIVEPQKHIVELAKNAMLRAGIRPVVCPIRGGTDGSHLSFRGLPCTNIFAGGLNFHGRYEFVPVQSMEKAVDVITGIIELNICH